MVPVVGGQKNECYAFAENHLRTHLRKNFQAKKPPFGGFTTLLIIDFILCFPW
jgi:hypothetical protein